MQSCGFRIGFHFTGYGVYQALSYFGHKIGLFSRVGFARQ
jgi:hypothetical protein